MPPVWAEPSAPKLTGKSLFCAAAGFDGDGVADRVQHADAVHPAQIEDDLIAAGCWDGASNQAGIAALGYDAGPYPGAEFDDCRDLRSGLGQHHAQRLVAGQAAPVGLKGRAVLGRDPASRRRRRRRLHRRHQH